MTFILDLRCGDTVSRSLGAHAECGNTATVTADGPSLAARTGAEAGWSVDDPMVGFFSRSDRCPLHTAHAHFWQRDALLPVLPAYPLAG